MNTLYIEFDFSKFEVVKVTVKTKERNTRIVFRSLNFNF